MNTRLQTRLAEWEVLKIISDTTEAVACMHYLRPPLLHRDLKIENVLISGNGDYKLCDFGSCTEPRAAATNSQERRALEEDIQKNTTIQYRSPEMVDVSRRLPIDEKSDIWALGVLLYKLCYFTTPFEAQGQLAILNAAYTFPPYPPYTDRTKRLIAVTLQENPRDRPNIYQLLAEICAMRNVPVPIPDIYTKSRSTSSRPTSRPSSRPPTAHNDDILIYDKPDIKPATSSTHAIDIVPMRRGRPERSSSPPKADPAITSQSRRSSRPNTKGHVAVGEEVEFTTKFPSLEEMNFGLDDRTPAPSSLDYDSAAINQVGEPSGSLQEPSSMNEQDESRLRQPSNPTQSRPLPITPPHNSPLELLDLEERVLKPSEVARSGGNYMRTQPDASRIEADGYVLRNTDHQANNDRRIPSSGPVPIVRPKPTHLENNQNIRTDLKKSTNPYAQVSTSPDDQPQIRPTMVNRASQTSPKRNQGVQTQTSPAKKEPLPRMTKEPNVSSNLIRDSSGLLISRGTSRNEGTSSMPAQSKPQFRFTTSLDRPNDNMLAQEEVMRSKSAQGARPQTIHVGSGIDFLRDLDSPLTSTTRSGSLEIVRTGGSQISHPGQDEAGPSTGYLDVQQASSAGASIRRSVSVNGPNNRHHKRPSISSIPSFSGAAKNIMNGKFSDAFKKFEASGRSRGTTPVMERSNPLMVAEDDLPGNILTPYLYSLLKFLAHITQHLQSSEARRSSSYSRNRPSIELLSGESVYKPKLEKTESIESTSTSVREAMRKLKEKVSSP